MIDKTAIPGLDLNTTEAKIQMNNFWKYLDELAEKNPEEYKKFIQTQMKKGLETFGPSKNQSITTKQEFTVSPYLCFRFKPIKILKEESKENKDDILIHEKAGNEIKEVPQIKFGPEFQSDAFNSNVIQDRKIYLNVVMSREYYTPTDDQGNFLKGDKFKDENNWRYIPTEFRYCGKQDSMSCSRCDFYDVIINQDIIDKINKDEGLYKTILGYIVRKFVIFLNNKVILYTNSVKIVQDKKYKSVLPKPEVFKSKLGEKSLAAEKAQQRHIEQVQKSQQQQTKPIDKIIIPGSAEANALEESQSKESILPKKEEKKVVIQEIESSAVNKQIISMKKKILNNHQMEVQFMFDEFEYLQGFKEIDLQISENGIIIHLDNKHYIIDQNYEPVEMKFNFKVDPDKCTAKYNKKEKILTVIIEKID